MTAAPDARLTALHAETGDPLARLGHALADLEGAEWGLLLSGEAALAQQLAALLGAGTLRLDPLLKLNREVFAAAGLALATIDADWRGARAVWLLEPDERAFKRAQRAGVQIIADATLAPGGDWLRRGAAYAAYRDGATLSGFGDVQLSALFGVSPVAPRAAPAPSDLSMAMVLRDLATLPLRLARAARTTSALADHFGGAAQSAGPTALLLAPDSAADTHAPLGGVLAAAVNVSAGTLITPGVQALEGVLALLRSEPLAQSPSAQPSLQGALSPASPEQAPQATERRSAQGTRPTQAEQPNQADQGAPARRPEPLDYTPEIVFSDSLSQAGSAGLDAAHTQSTPVSSGPDESDTALSNPEVEMESEASTKAPEPPRDEAHLAESRAEIPAPEPEPEPEIILPPDLPSNAAADPTEGMSDVQRAAFTRLRDWRNAEAKKLELSRFIIASNATLAEISRKAPQNEAELRQVRGMGPERVRKYGQALLRVVSQ